MKTLSLKTETVRVLSGDELDGVAGGVKSAFKWTGPINNPFETSVSSARAPGHKVSSVFNPTATAVSSAKPGPVAHPTSTVQTISSVLRPR